MMKTRNLTHLALIPSVWSCTSQPHFSHMIYHLSSHCFSQEDTRTHTTKKKNKALPRGSAPWCTHWLHFLLPVGHTFSINSMPYLYRELNTHALTDGLTHHLLRSLTIHTTRPYTICMQLTTRSPRRMHLLLTNLITPRASLPLGTHARLSSQLATCTYPKLNTLLACLHARDRISSAHRAAASCVTTQLQNKI